MNALAAASAPRIFSPNARRRVHGQNDVGVSLVLPPDILDQADGCGRRRTKKLSRLRWRDSEFRPEHGFQVDPLLIVGRAEAEAESTFLLRALEQEIDVESTGLAVLLGDPGPLDHADRVALGKVPSAG